MEVRSGLLAFWALATATVSCAGPSSSPADGRLQVVSTVTQVSALARAVGGDRIALTPLLTAHDNLHEFQLKPDQAAKLARARVILASGAGVDEWLDEGVDAAGVRDRVVDLSRSVKLRAGASGSDPHWWYDIANAKLATDAIADVLGRAHPAGRDIYRENADAQKKRLDEADRRIRSLIDPVPPERRLFVANHEAFNYLLDRYGITLVGDIVPSTDSTAAVRPADVARLVSEIKARRVCAVFTETTIDRKLSEQIASEAKVRVQEGGLFADALADPGQPGATLEDALVRNATTMAEAFRSC